MRRKEARAHFQQAGPGSAGQRQKLQEAAQARRKSGRLHAGREQRCRTRAHLRQSARTAARAATGKTRAGAPGAKAATTAAGRTKTATPADGAARRAQKTPSEQAKFAFALLPARRGFVERGRQKLTSLFLAGTVFFCFALRTARRAALHKRGRRPRSLACRLGRR